MLFSLSLQYANEMQKTATSPTTPGFLAAGRDTTCEGACEDVRANVRARGNIENRRRILCLFVFVCVCVCVCVLLSLFVAFLLWPWFLLFL